MPSIDFSGLKRELEEAYESEFFPMYCLVGGILAVALTDDILWLGVGVVGFVVFLFKRR